MATPKEQHDARPHAHSMGTSNLRAHPADATIYPPADPKRPVPSDLEPAPVPADTESEVAGPLPDR